MMKCLTRLGIQAASLVVLLSSAAAGQVTPGPQQPPQDPYVVGRALPPQDPGRPLVELTLAQAIARALEANLDIQSVKLDPAIQAFSLDAARAAFSPTWNTTFGYNNATNQSTSQLD